MKSMRTVLIGVALTMGIATGAIAQGAVVAADDEAAE